MRDDGDDYVDISYADSGGDEAPVYEPAPEPTYADPPSYDPAPDPAVYDPPSPKDDSGGGEGTGYEIPAPAPFLGTSSYHVETMIAPAAVAVATSAVRTRPMSQVSTDQALQLIIAARQAYGLTTADAQSDLESVMHLEGNTGTGFVDTATIDRYVNYKYPAWSAPTIVGGGSGGDADLNGDGLFDQGWYLIGASNDNPVVSRSPTGYADRLAATGDELGSGPLSVDLAGVSGADLYRSIGLRPRVGVTPQTVRYTTTSTGGASLPGPAGSSQGGPAASPLDAAMMAGRSGGLQAPVIAAGAPADAGAGSGMMLAIAALAAYWFMSK